LKIHYETFDTIHSFKTYPKKSKLHEICMKVTTTTTTTTTTTKYIEPWQACTHAQWILTGQSLLLFQTGVVEADTC